MIVAEAQQRSDVIRGEGEAERNKVFAEVFGKDPEFFSFYRSMQAYEASIKPGDTRMVLTPDSPFFRFFNGANTQRQDGQATAPATPAAPAPARP